MVAFFVCFLVLFFFLVVGRSGENFCDCTHSCSIKNEKKKLLKKEKKGKHFKKKKKDKQLHLVFNVWLSASIFSCFWCISDL